MEIGSTYSYVDGGMLVAVPEGEFLMGDDDSENPEHKVFVSSFWIYSTEVTNQQYKLCVILGECTPPALNHNPGYNEVERANDPAVGVNFEQAAAYCSFVNGRLPTEAEWEKVARGPEGNTYPWGDTEPSCNLLNYFSCEGRTTSVLNYQPGASYYGALDMAGNAYEWVADWYDAAYYQNSPEQNPLGPSDGTNKSVRSSGYKTEAQDTAVAIRHSYDPQEQHSDLGFRCVVDEPDYFASFCDAPPVFGQTASDASETCPLVGIEQSPACAKKLSTTNIVFKGPDDAALNPGVCAPTGDPRVFICLGAGQVSISASCEVDLSGEPTCSSGYSLDGSTCQANSTQGTCLGGMGYDSAQGCCALESQIEAASIPPICPVGTYYVAGQNVCASTPLHGIVSVVEFIELKACEGKGNTKSCQGPPPEGCSGIYDVWDPVECKCIEVDPCIPTC